MGEVFGRIFEIIAGLFCIVFFGGIFLAPIWALLSWIYESIQDSYLCKKSLRLKELNILNKEFKFEYLMPEYKVHYNFRDKEKYDNFDISAIANGVFYQYIGEITTFQETADENTAKYHQYLAEIEKIKRTIQEAPWPFRKEEESSFDKKIQHPTTEWYFIIEKTTGRKYNQTIESKKYSYHEAMRGAEIVKQAKEEELERIGKRKAQMMYERSLVTDSVRYDVLKRDGFRCQICGASASDGIQLHVDHIKPIAKGGRSTMTNLRTLCDRCNRGKSDKYDISGLN